MQGAPFSCWCFRNEGMNLIPFKEASSWMVKPLYQPPVRHFTSFWRGGKGAAGELPVQSTSTGPGLRLSRGAGS